MQIKWIVDNIRAFSFVLTNWNKEPDKERIYRWGEFFHKLDNTKWKMRTGARATKQNYISIYISLSMKTFLKTGVYIYIYRLFATREWYSWNCFFSDVNSGGGKILRVRRSSLFSVENAPMLMQKSKWFGVYLLFIYLNTK